MLCCLFGFLRSLLIGEFGCFFGAHPSPFLFFVFCPVLCESACLFLWFALVFNLAESFRFLPSLFYSLTVVLAHQSVVTLVLAFVPWRESLWGCFLFAVYTINEQNRK